MIPSSTTAGQKHIVSIEFCSRTHWFSVLPNSTAVATVHPFLTEPNRKWLHVTRAALRNSFCTQHLPQVTNSTPWLCHPSAQTSDSCKWQKIVPWHKKHPWQAAHLAQRSGFSDKKHVDYPEVFGYFRPREEGKRSHLHNWDSGIGAWQDRTVPQVPLSQWTRFFKGSSWKMGKTAENNYQDPSALLKTQKLFFMVFQIAWWQHSAACDAQPHTWERKWSCKACKRRQEAGMNLLKEWHSCERKTSRRAAAHTTIS